MRRGFEFALRQYNTEIDEIEKAKITGDEQKLQQETFALEKVLGRRAEASASSIENQQEILEIQKEKREIFRQMRASFKALEADKLDEEPGLIKMSYDARTKLFSGYSKQGRQFFLTIGELFNNIEWDIFYNFDESVSKPVKKEYLLARARKRIRDLLDVQILIEETANQRSIPGRREAYKRTRESVEKNELVSGWIAETAVRGFLNRLVMDFRLKFEVDRADIFMDVDHKVDFVLRRPRYHRGVGIERKEETDETDDKPREKTEKTEEEGEEEEYFDDDVNNGLGIQFTISTTTLDLSRKRRQMLYARAYLPENKLKDLILVSIPLKKVKQTYLRWQKAVEGTGISFGGPEQYWNEKIQFELIDGLLSTFLSPRNVERVKQLVRDREELRRRRIREAFGWPKPKVAEQTEQEEKIDEFDGLGFQECYEKMAREWRPELGKRQWQLFKKFAEQTKTSPDVQNKIYQLINKKVMLALKLSEAAKMIGNSETPKTKRVISYDSESGWFFRELNGKRIEMSEGDILSALEWELVPDFDGSVPVDLRLEILRDQTNRRIMELNDRIILALMTGRMDVDEAQKRRYQEVFGALEKPPGLSELKKRAVLSFLRRLAVDFGLEIDAKSADLRARVEDGADLIISFNQKVLKVKIEDLPFTAAELGNLENWRKIAKGKNINAAPDLLWSLETQIRIAERVLGKILPSRSLDDLKKRIAAVFSFNQKRVKKIAL